MAARKDYHSDADAWKGEEKGGVNWRGDLNVAGHGSFEQHPLHQETYPWALDVLKFCQKLITSAESTVNDDVEVEFKSWPPIESLCDLRKHVMAVSAKLAGGLSSENRDAEEIKVSLEFVGKALAHIDVVLALIKIMLLDSLRTHEEKRGTVVALEDFHQRGVCVRDRIARHSLSLTNRLHP